MKIELTKQQIEALLQIIQNTSFKGDSAEFIVQLKKDLQASLTLNQQNKIKEE